MPNFLDTLLIDSAFITDSHWFADGSLLVMWGALLLHLIIPIPRSIHPVRLWHAFAQLLSDKVNTNNSYSQSLTSGLLAVLLMCGSLLITLSALEHLVWQKSLFELALLLLALDWQGNDRFANRLIKALLQQDKSKARQLLAPRLNRQTATLSELGLGKAGAETLIIGYGRHVICVLFWYAIGGGIAAFVYRFTSELARAWSPSRSQYLPFGLPIIRLLAILDIVPLRCFSLLIALGHNMSITFKGIFNQAQQWPLPGPAWLLAAVGCKLELSLCGPAIYIDKRTGYIDKQKGGEKKSIRGKIGGRVVPASIHLTQIKRLMAGRIVLWILLQSIILLLIHKGL